MAGFTFYNYDPSLAAAAVFVIIFAVTTFLHMWQMFRYRAWYFIPFLIGCLFEAFGYIGRALSANEAPDYTKNPYIMQSILILLGPALLAASIYMTLGRLIALLDADHLSIIRTKWLTKVFVIGDVLSFFAQSGGGGMLATAKSKDSVEKGENIIVGGLLIQIIFFGFFIVVTVVFHARIHSRPTARSLTLTTPWEKLLYVLYATSLFILVRSVFRVAEYVLGKEGALQADEYWIYIFDATLMALVAVLFNAFHPSRVINNRAGDKATYTVDEYPLQGA
ncbi:hypothetical protein FSARC_15040 [Fusarium sarcochroum]|uniref:Uncharacterized protein n=1 Tax=Fusarium sarcochroum TaxID=1208366 RepID=A0A8H4SNV8_9HYPO|nr:hypothetical protein FSARC_15040 [Fusarium sarcochroum]